MNFKTTKYRNVNIISVDNVDTDFVIKALDLINKPEEKWCNLLNNVSNIFIGSYQKNSAVAATFVKEKSIVLTPYNTDNAEFIASIMIHELTHLKHYQTNPTEYSNQKVAEKFAFENEINFLNELKNKELAEESQKIRDSFLAFLEKNNTTTKQKTTKLEKENANMSYHQKIINEYFNY